MEICFSDYSYYLPYLGTSTSQREGEGRGEERRGEKRREEERRGEKRREEKRRGKKRRDSRTDYFTNRNPCTIRSNPIQSNLLSLVAMLLAFFCNGIELKIFENPRCCCCFVFFFKFVFVRYALSR